MSVCQTSVLSLGTLQSGPRDHRTLFSMTRAVKPDGEGVAVVCIPAVLCTRCVTLGQLATSLSLCPS